VIVESVVVETIGDARVDVPLAEISGRGVFTTEVDQAVLDGRADVAVHSAKDLPAGTAIPGLVLAAVPERADVRDALVGAALDGLQQGSAIATGAPRRRVQLRHARPDLNFVEVRGNIGTRLGRVPEGGALVVALAALVRLGLEDQAAEILPVEVMLPQIGQGAIALRCRGDDELTLEALEVIDDPQAHSALRAERAFLARLGGGCEAPVGAYATIDADGMIHLEAMIASIDEREVIRRRALGDDPEQVGTSLASSMLEIDGAAELFGLT
jgi:hydroxymethylbilane synthase